MGSVLYLSPLAVPTANAKKSLSEHKNNKITKIL